MAKDARRPCNSLILAISSRRRATVLLPKLLVAGSNPVARSNSTRPLPRRPELRKKPLVFMGTFFWGLEARSNCGDDLTSRLLETSFPRFPLPSFDRSERR